MKNLALGIYLVLGLFACSTGEVEQTGNSVDRLPTELLKVMNAHGGLQNWNEMQTLQFSIPKGEFNEIHTIDLHSRMDRVMTPSFDIGFDGDSAWVKEKSGEYNDDPSFRHNLMFYFFAMPFVMADKGISYDETPPLAYGGKNYPGFKITYAAGVGSSSKDVYMLHYDPETFQMSWLGYKATFGEELKDGPPNWVKYYEWAQVNGISMPKSVAWQKVENGEISGDRNRVNFMDISLSKDKKPASFYTKNGSVE